MARVLVAWELGAGYGHIERIAPVAGRLRARGHTLAYAFRDLVRTETRRGRQVEFFVRVETGKVTELDVLELVDRR